LANIRIIIIYRIILSNLLEFSLEKLAFLIDRNPYITKSHESVGPTTFVDGGSIIRKKNPTTIAKSSDRPIINFLSGTLINLYLMNTNIMNSTVKSSSKLIPINGTSRRSK